ncbi:MAG: threonine-phosphate decarboxylase CobD [Bacillota bacterium]|jgi:threonine-phosphate decarboxylase
MDEHGGNIYRYNRMILDFSANINPLGVPESFQQALRERVGTFALYPDPAYRTLKQQVAAYLGVDPEWVIVGNGAVDLIYRAIWAAGRDRVYGLAPTFSEYRYAAQLAKAEYRDLPLFTADYARFDFTKMSGLVEPNATVVLCNPNNPTGTMAARDELGQVAERLAGQNSYLIVDEAFIEFTDSFADRTMLPLAARYPNLLVIRAATKFFGMPGLRLGYGVSANRAWRERLQALAQPWTVNTAAVLAAEVIFKDWDYQQRSREWITAERKFLYEELAALPEVRVYPSQANFFLVKLLRTDLDAAQLQGRLITQGILIRGPQGFTGLTPNHFRVAVKDRASNERLVAALQEILVCG